MVQEQLIKEKEKEINLFLLDVKKNEMGGGYIARGANDAITRWTDLKNRSTYLGGQGSRPLYAQQELGALGAYTHVGRKRSLRTRCIPGNADRYR